MDPISVVEHDVFLTTLVSPIDESTLYTVTSRRHPDGFWIDVVHRIERGHSRHSESEKPQIETKLATVFYIDAGTTRVSFPENLNRIEEGQELGIALDTFLRRREPYSNSRIFMGPGGVTYKWRVDGKKLKLFNTTNHALIARSQPRRSNFSFPLWLPGMTKPTSRLSTARTERTASLLHPTLSLHPALLSLESDPDAPQLRDAIVVTFIIMQRLLKERLQYRYL